MIDSINAIGVDICEVKRIETIISRYQQRILQRLYTPNEIAYCTGIKPKFQSYAARFAAKEAFLKALGTGLRGGLQWKDIEVLNDPLGKPYFRFYNKALEVIGKNQVLLSLAHTAENAVAFVMIRGIL
jgi:holo-[acyl-carrier protein] synthase